MKKLLKVKIEVVFEFVPHLKKGVQILKIYEEN